MYYAGLKHLAAWHQELGKFLMASTGEGRGLPWCIGVGTGGSKGKLAPHFPGRGAEGGLRPPPLLGSHISQDPAKIPLLSPTQFHGTDS